MILLFILLAIAVLVVAAAVTLAWFTNWVWEDLEPEDEIDERRAEALTRPYGSVTVLRKGDDPRKPW